MYGKKISKKKLKNPQNIFPKKIFKKGNYKVSGWQIDTNTDTEQKSLCLI